MDRLEVVFQLLRHRDLGRQLLANSREKGLHLLTVFVLLLQIALKLLLLFIKGLGLGILSLLEAVPEVFQDLVLLREILIIHLI